MIWPGYVYIEGHVRTSHEAQNGESMSNDIRESTED